MSNQTPNSKNKTCEKCQVGFDITDKDLEFYDRISPVLHGVKYAIPTPRLCPDCRQQRRMIWRNESVLYTRKCDFSGKPTISVYDENSRFTIYSYKVYQDRDKWNPEDYGMEYMDDVDFLEQFKELQLKVPRPSRNLFFIENSEYCHQSWHIKNCYLCFNVGYSEDCYYCSESYYCKNTVNCLDVKNLELCCYCVQSIDLYNCVYAEKSSNCNDSHFIFDCKGCSDLILCSNLRNKKHCIRNKQYTEEEYKKLKETFDFGSHTDFEKYLEEFQQIKSKAICKENSNLHTESSSGDLLERCKGCDECYNCHETEDCKFVYNCDGKAKDCYDLNYCAEAELCYEGSMVAGFKNLFCHLMPYGDNNFYSDNLENCSNCFGCISMKRREYCILNKQYTREEYEFLVPKIIRNMQKVWPAMNRSEATGAWGEFFPVEFAAFAYNETVAQEFFPLTKEEAIGQGFRWKEEDRETKSQILNNKLQINNNIQNSNIPNHIFNVDDSICNEVLICEVSGKNFKIIPMELKLYRQLNIPIPRKCPDQRHKERISLRNPRYLHTRECDKCGKNIKTTYSKNRVETIYCESCYLKEVY